MDHIWRKEVAKWDAMILSSCFLIYLPLTRRCSKIWKWSGRHHMRYDLTKWNPWMHRESIRLGTVRRPSRNTYLNSEDRGVLIPIGTLISCQSCMCGSCLSICLWPYWQLKQHGCRKSGKKCERWLNVVDRMLPHDLFDGTRTYICLTWTNCDHHVLLLPISRAALNKWPDKSLAREHAPSAACFFFFFEAGRVSLGEHTYSIIQWLLFITFHSLYHCNRGTGSPTRAAGWLCCLVVTTRLKSGTNNIKQLVWYTAHKTRSSQPLFLDGDLTSLSPPLFYQRSGAPPSMGEYGVLWPHSSHVDGRRKGRNTTTPNNSNALQNLWFFHLKDFKRESLVRLYFPKKNICFASFSIKGRLRFTRVSNKHSHIYVRYRAVIMSS